MTTMHDFTLQNTLFLFFHILFTSWLHPTYLRIPQCLPLYTPRCRIQLKDYGSPKNQSRPTFKAILWETISILWLDPHYSILFQWIQKSPDSENQVPSPLQYWPYQPLEIPSIFFLFFLAPSQWPELLILSDSTLRSMSEWTLTWVFPHLVSARAFQWCLR